ncbi:hypothetical protein THAR02_09233 [Trichoderma harzianum]|uniref:SH3 domain-containing protein n=1 Tax=Trichoderma harzianum TaxID=5544 RepID=A0A0F9XDE9_TRIHA|nr:hypothetical protein THAR02_09233 [Trichoderma harzianum]
MGLVQALRRSIKGDKEKQHSISITPKAAVAIVPPKKVIRALYDYEARSAQELGFSKGDFFHVIGREDDPDWYEACNPALPDARGLVPVAFFQALGKTERDSQQSDGGRPPTANKNPDHDSGYGEVHSPGGASAPPASQRMSKSAGKQGAMVYGVVMYDFNAERSDELEAKAGEAIIVIAQSNPEWFVAKPIGRLGGPGLIPVSFIELRDMGTGKAIENPAEAIRKAGVPKVEEWKKMATAYKNSSITLGKFEGGGPSQPLEQGMERMSIQNAPQVSLCAIHHISCPSSLPFLLYCLALFPPFLASLFPTSFPCLAHPTLHLSTPFPISRLISCFLSPFSVLVPLPLLASSRSLPVVHIFLPYFTSLPSAPHRPHPLTPVSRSAFLLFRRPLHQPCLLIRH